MRLKKVFKTLKESFGLIDIWQTLNPNKREYTYHNNNAHSRLDRFYISSDLEKTVKSAIIQPSFISDHSFIRLDLKFDTDQSTDQEKTKYMENEFQYSKRCGIPLRNYKAYPGNLC